VVLLFDAKYKVQFLHELFGQTDQIVDEADSEASYQKEVKRDDLIKMHAYRDAIRRAAGAYVLYPGSEDPGKREFFSEYHELLPGLGAFVLRPTEEGEAVGVASLRSFIDQVLDHVASRLTQHERGRYWLREVYQPRGSQEGSSAEVVLGKPLPETPILLGYVKSEEHWAWITSRRTYNVRTIGRTGGVAVNADMLRTRFLLLYCPALQRVALTRIISDPELVPRDAMERTGYPQPRGDYLCVQWGWAASQEWVNKVNAIDVDQLVQRSGLPEGSPVAVLWKEIEELRTR
jgi:hypothetical protein